LIAFTLLIGVAIVASVLFSLEPAGSRIIGISTPYKKSGLLFTKYDNHFDKNDDDTLVIQAPSRTMNSATLSQAYVDRAMRADPAKASAEYLAEFFARHPRKRRRYGLHRATALCPAHLPRLRRSIRRQERQLYMRANNAF
jgi:hypothetical protein